MSLTIQALRKAYPWIRWHEPVPIQSGGRTGFACRICLAQHGHKGYDPPPFKSYKHALWHLMVAHGEAPEPDEDPHPDAA